MKKMNVSWQEYEKRLKRMILEMDKDGRNAIIAVAKGGLIPATQIANIAEVPFGIVHFSSYDFLERPTNVEYKGSIFSTVPTTKRVAIVDDIYDTGRTTNSVMALLSACGYYDVKAYYLIDKRKKNDRFSKDGWVVFPWERL
jgi:hypoxanthine phosphoribosyltransferase